MNYLKALLCTILEERRRRIKGIYCKQQRDGLDDGHIPTPLIYSKVQICPTMTTFSSDFGLWEYGTKDNFPLMRCTR